MANRDDNTHSDPAPGGSPGPLQPADEQFRVMVQQIRDYAVFMLDPEGYIRSWNLGAELIKGYTADEVIGKHFSILYPAEEIGTGKPARELQMAKAGGGVDLEEWRLRKDGSRFWASITITPLYDAKGAHLGFCKITRDAGDRRSMEETLRRSRGVFEKLFEKSPDAIVVVDDNGVIRKVNQQTEILFGYLRDELMGIEVERLMPERYRERHRQHLKGYFQDPRARKMGIGLELYGLNREGREIPVDIMLAPMDAAEGSWAFAVIRDISRQKQSEAEINNLNAALKTQIEQLEATNRELESFSYSVSHDLRAPLRHVSGFVDLLNARASAELDDKSRHYLEVISEAADKMGHLIDDLLAFSRMGRAEIMRTRVDFGLLVRGIVKEVAEEAKGRDIEWVIGALPEVVGDSAMLRQVIYNLLANAVKFTRDRGSARIEVGALEQETETFFFVRDNGVGFDAAYGKKLFGLFQRLHRTEEFEGTGVGLAIVQRIIARHGGRVWAEGALDEGATFWFSLPKR